jgi:DnaK suppressor protein
VAETTLTPEQLRHLRAKLEAKRSELTRKSREHIRTATHSDDALTEEGDLANRQVDVNEALGLATHEQALLAEIESALERFERGTFGLSEESGHPIPFERLDAIPWARTDADEAEREERGRR